MIECVGAAQTVFATSLRKACSLVLSYFLFPKPITMQHFVGGALVCLGIYLNGKAKGGPKSAGKEYAAPEHAVAEQISQETASSDDNPDAKAVKTPSSAAQQAPKDSEV